MACDVEVANESVRYWEKISGHTTILNIVLMGVDQYSLANFTSFMFHAYLIVLYLIYYFSFDEKRSLICMPLF